MRGTGLWGTLVQFLFGAGRGEGLVQLVWGLKAQLCAPLLVIGVGRNWCRAQERRGLWEMLVQF